MLHRHLNHDRLTLAAIDDIILRGGRVDWARLRRAVLEEPAIREKVKRICDANTADPYAQRYHFWKYYVEHRPA